MPVEVVLAGFEDNGCAVNLSLFVVADVDVLESKCAVHAAPNASGLKHKQPAIFTSIINNNNISQCLVLHSHSQLLLFLLLLLTRLMGQQCFARWLLLSVIVCNAAIICI